MNILTPNWKLKELMTTLKRRFYSQLNIHRVCLWYEPKSHLLLRQIKLSLLIFFECMQMCEEYIGHVCNELKIAVKASMSKFRKKFHSHVDLKRYSLETSNLIVWLRLWAELLLHFDICFCYVHWPLKLLNTKSSDVQVPLITLTFNSCF